MGFITPSEYINDVNNHIVISSKTPPIGIGLVPGINPTSVNPNATLYDITGEIPSDLIRKYSPQWPINSVFKNSSPNLARAITTALGEYDPFPAGREFKTSDAFKAYIDSKNLYKSSGPGKILLRGAVNSILPVIPESGQYADIPFSRIGFRRLFNGLQDYRQLKDLGFERLDGTVALANSRFKSPAARKMVAANVATGLLNYTGGTYAIFNIERYYGFGDPGEFSALRRDFTMRTAAATKWNADTGYKQDIKTRVIPFRGDKVNVRDFATITNKSQIYEWRNSTNLNGKPGKLINWVENNVNSIGNSIGSNINSTRDFIKFYFSGPENNDGSFDIFVFRATISSLIDSFSPDWTPVDMIGRPDKNYIYTGFERSLDLQFSVYAASRDELKPMWRKLNFLASYTMPDYSDNYITYKGKYLRLTLGDLFLDDVAIITSLTYTLAEQETTWEINIEEDPDNKQVPQRIDVNIQMKMLTKQIPEYKGNVYALHGPERSLGNDNWLNDSVSYKENTPESAIESEPTLRGRWDKAKNTAKRNWNNRKVANQNIQDFNTLDNVGNNLG